MKNNPIYMNARKIKRQKERRWMLVHLGAVALLVGSVLIAFKHGEGTHLLITVPLAIFALFSGMEE
jgi:uncharacterized membrane protein HdeD (DUF308 family)